MTHRGGPGPARDPLALLALAAVVLAVAATVLWIRWDEFLDGDEAQHALRTLAALRGLEAWLDGQAGLAAALAPRLEEPKPWYGFPYYAAAAVAWRVAGVQTDTAVLLNLGYLAVLLACAGWLAHTLTGTTAGIAPAVLVLAVLPGTLTWSHFFNPTLCFAAALALASALLVSSRGFGRPIASLLAGAALAAAALVKVSAPLYVLPVAVYVALRDGRANPARRGARGVALFLAGFAPAAAWWAAHADVLRFWSEMARGLFGSAPEAQPFLAAARIWSIGFMPLPLLVVWAAAGYALARAGDEERRRTVFLLGWMVVPGVLLWLLAGFVGTGRDYLPSALPAALLVASASVRLAPAWRIAGGAVLLAHGTLYCAAFLFGAGPSWLPGLMAGPRRIHPPTAQGQRPLFRTNPLVDLAKALDVLVPPGTASRCGCLPFPPYPTPGARQRPVVLVDSALASPETLAAWMALHRGDASWQFGYVPYGLSCGAYRTALQCAAAVVVAPSGATAVDAGFDLAAGRDDRRAALRAWGRDGGTVPIAHAGPLAARLADRPGPCQGGIDDSELRDCGEDFYVLHLAGRVAGGEAGHALESRAAALAARRRDDLAGGADPQAVRFGEAYLARAVAEAGPPR